MGKSKTPKRGQPPEDPVAVRSEVVLVSMANPVPAHAYCHYCQTRPATTRDHIVPKARGGSSRWWNLVPSCQRCNLSKGHSFPDCTCEFCRRARSMHETVTLRSRR